ncbi:MAG: Ig-like domain-containing protein [Spirochaetaceae bacterium]|jgi:hypothetical protein|nr:Ig-like domain-containing protein [Spirochaetaceae bacterium]
MKTIFCVLAVVVLAACGLVDLRPIGVEIAADGAGSALASHHSPVKIVFDCGMAKAETESVVSVKSIRGNTEIDRRWEANALVLTPVQGWSPGIVYTVSLSGVIRATDGREERIAEYAAFQYGTAQDIPFVVSFYPADGAKTGVSEEAGAFVRLFFSQPMDRSSVQDAFVLNGFSDKEYTWNDERTAFTVTNKKKIAPLESYTWTLAATAKSATGFLLDREISAQWTSDAETAKPAVFRVYPVAKKEDANGVEWQETGNPIEKGFGYGEAVKIAFTKKMDTASLKNSVRFEPAISGITEIINSSNIVFIPERDPIVDTYYAMTVSGEAKDETGLTMGENYTVHFTPDIVYLEAEIKVFDEPVVNGGAVTIEFDSDEEEVSILMTFNQVFLGENQIDCVNQIKFSKVFPADAPVPVLIYADWTSDKMFAQIWSKLSDQKEHSHPHYYKCVIPGGQNGITNGKGAYLKEDIVFYINVTFK